MFRVCAYLAENELDMTYTSLLSKFISSRIIYFRLGPKLGFVILGFFACRYVRVLGAFYLRLTGTDIDIYRYLEPLYNDYRKLRRKLADGSKLCQLSSWFRFYS